MNYTPILEKEPEDIVQCSKCVGKAFREWEYYVTLMTRNNIFTFTYRCLNNHVTEVKIKEKNIDGDYDKQPV